MIQILSQIDKNNTLVETVSYCMVQKRNLNENTDQHVIEVLGESVDETISIQDIDQTHRLPGKKPNGKSRPIIVEFVRCNTRNLIFKNKKKLKGSRISITENPTAKEWKNCKQEEINADLKKFRRKMERLCIGIQLLTELNYIVINVYSHGILRFLTRNRKIVWALFY